MVDEIDAAWAERLANAANDLLRRGLPEGLQEAADRMGERGTLYVVGVAAGFSQFAIHRGDNGWEVDSDQFFAMAPTDMHDWGMDGSFCTSAHLINTNGIWHECADNIIEAARVLEVLYEFSCETHGSGRLWQLET